MRWKGINLWNKVINLKLKFNLVAECAKAAKLTVSVYPNLRFFVVKMSGLVDYNYSDRDESEEDFKSTKKQRDVNWSIPLFRVQHS